MVTDEDRDVAHQYAHCFSGDGIEMAEELAKDFAAHRERGYLRGVEDAAKVAVAQTQWRGSHTIARMIRALGAKPHDQ